MPLSYLLIFERTPPEYIIFASTDCQKVLGYTPEEMVGTSALDYSGDPYARHYSCAWPEDNPELGVTMLPHNLRRKDGSLVFSHYIAINCSGHIFAYITAFPEMGHVPLSESVLYKIQHEINFGHEPTRPVQPTEQRNHELVKPDLEMVTKESLHKAHIYTARASRAKACFILNRHDPDGHGPTIDFVTNSISGIFSGDTDGHEITGVSFLSIVAPEDVSRAAVYLDNLCADTKPQLCALRLLRTPMGARDELVNVELFGASSDEKILLLCQRRREKPVNVPSTSLSASAGEVSELPPKPDAPFMSLEEIISSDPDTTDVGGYWSEVMF
ncbi:hypothetical protein GGI25_004733 [Coemansia spiralis]|uniref:PAS domain-containing protein n=2 Tax=Coemansia TaxID=4863 RepID=A0A9W8G5I7_9FUNG|nr:hypothetical protein BX070DRAFT_235993 [Coemansia spiralis]KAJ1989707.1 hypothetical protein EDC05_004505 [Coemansia umbellata]KAJ2673398.1 hypothetical protein GGI25_004733 [Coemansia spiralis]